MHRWNQCVLHVFFAIIVLLLYHIAGKFDSLAVSRITAKFKSANFTCLFILHATYTNHINLSHTANTMSSQLYTALSMSEYGVAEVSGEKEKCITGQESL